MGIHFNSFTMLAFTVNMLGDGYHEGGPIGIRQTVYLKRFISVNSYDGGLYPGGCEIHSPFLTSDIKIKDHLSF